MASLKTLLNEYGKRISAGAYPANSGLIKYAVGDGTDYETTITAPADGWIYVCAKCGLVDVVNRASGLSSTLWFMSSISAIQSGFIPCHKGDQIWVHIHKMPGGSNGYTIAFIPNSAGG